MFNRVVLGTILMIMVGMIAYATSLRPAAACNRTAGCAMDNFQENYEMMHTGKMTEAMRAGQENIEAFRRLKEAEQAWALRGNSSMRTR